MDDLEIYSTVLWHMKKETDLMYLAHELMSIDRLAPQSWCVLGNCFSLGELRLHSNCLSGPLPDTLARCPLLRELNVDPAQLPLPEGLRRREEAGELVVNQRRR